MASTDIQLVQAEPVPEHSVDRMAEIKAQIAALDREYERLREMVVTGLASGLLWQAVVSSVTRRTSRLPMRSSYCLSICSRRW